MPQRHIPSPFAQLLLADRVFVLSKHHAIHQNTFWPFASISELNHIPLTYDSVTDTFSLKYNFAFDILFGTDFFDKTMMEKEVDHYIEVMEEFGVPLDSRSSISKSDWQLFVCTLTKDPKKKQKIYSAVAKYLRESPSRVPFSDLYFADSGVHRDFQNRTVQGGIFILLLEKEGLRGD